MNAERTTQASDDAAESPATLHHAQSPIALYTKSDAEFDQRMTVVGGLLTARKHVHRHQPSPTTVACLSQSATPNVHWSDFMSPEFIGVSQVYPDFLKTHRGIVEASVYSNKTSSIRRAVSIFCNKRFVTDTRRQTLVHSPR